MNFNEKMRLLRTELGLTQEQARKGMDISISSLRNYENDRFPDIEQLKRIQKFYKVSYEYLIDDECENRTEYNFKKQNKLNISDTTINILQKNSLEKNSYILENLIEYLHKKNISKLIEEYKKIDYIINVVFNNTLPKLEKLIKQKQYNKISDEEERDLELLINYNMELYEHNNLYEQNYIKNLIMANKYYNDFKNILEYVKTAINYNENIDKYKLEMFSNYKKTEEIFINYKTYLLTNTIIHIENDFIKNINI